MRILIIGSSKRWRMESGVERALRRAGHETLLLDDRRMAQRLGRRITQHMVQWRANRFHPELVFLSKCLGLELETVHRLVADRRSVMWYMDGPWYGDTERPGARHIAEVAKIADIMYCNGWDDDWRAHGANAKYLPAAGDRDIVPVALDASFAADVAFTGTGYDAGRAEFLAELAKRFDVKVWGKGWEQWRTDVHWTGRSVEHEDFARVCSSTKVMLGALPAPMKTATTSASNRMWITVLAGGFYLGAHSPGISKMLLGGVHCAWYDGFDDCVAKIQWYLEKPEERERIRRAGEEFVRRYHTFDERARHLVEGTEWRNRNMERGTWNAELGTRN